MAESRPAPALGPGARNYRRMMWLVVAASVPLFLFVLAGLKGLVPREPAVAATPVLFAGLAYAAWMGWRAHQQTLADRERAGSQAMILVIAARLKTQDESTLRQMARKPGPAGEAAAWVLKGRGERHSSGFRPPLPPPTEA